MIKTCGVCGNEFNPGSAWRATTCDECLFNGYKFCKGCQEPLPLERFGITKDGIRTRCKSCESARSRASQNKAKERNAEDFRERHKAANRKCYHAHADEKRDEYNQYIRDRYATVPEVRMRYYLKAHRRRNSATCSLSTDEWLEACKAFDFACAYCGESRKLTMDHVVPVIAGGGTCADNIIPVCGSCNSSKGAKDLIRWYTAQPFYSKERLDGIVRYLESKKGADAE